MVLVFHYQLQLVKREKNTVLPFDSGIIETSKIFEPSNHMDENTILYNKLISKLDVAL